MKNRYNMVVLATTELGKNLLFQVLFLIKKNVIVFFIIPILALIKNQLYFIDK